ncbi:hypothetical protein TNCV_1513881 [Trichonephila clavipes]|nr:hypothetical protein TNCV_1513881 [Trichonephila clavipes]
MTMLFMVQCLSTNLVDIFLLAIHIALSQLLCHTDGVSKVVILSDSRTAALQAIPSIEAPISADILKCQQIIGGILQGHIDLAMQWISSHCSIDGDENTDCSAKKGKKSFKPLTIGFL